VRFFFSLKLLFFSLLNWDGAVKNHGKSRQEPLMKKKEERSIEEDLLKKKDLLIRRGQL